LLPLIKNGENASNHLAIESAYPTCYEGGADLLVHESVAVGLNDSNVHEDFMIGSEKWILMVFYRMGYE